MRPAALRRSSMSKFSHLGTRAALAVLLAVAFVPLMPAAPAPAAGYTSVFGAGSTWSAIAIAAWQRDVALRGIPVNYQPLG